ncbi:type VI secretion system-associated protein TagF [Phenylobacterium sp.]|uniref:type VI secretion system-associated protein TagF n=1 Tax=Phenylobacterium sp. TaxID=1871053 RepID=UPI00286AFD35|nr:type VI secretion system-associated protein TagF [Phenylobacterium sp.]
MIGPGFNTGAFGKLPCAGDFVRRRLRADTITELDLWLQVRLADDPGGEPPDAATPCRFAAAPGVFGVMAVMGLIWPSRDSVGRSFPFVIAVEAGPRTAHVYDLDLDWFDLAEVALRRSIDFASLDDLDRALSDLQASVGLGAINQRIEFPAPASLWWAPTDIHDALALAGQPDAEAFAALTSSWREPPEADPVTTPTPTTPLEAGSKGAPI